ncbi:MAG: helix-turn-helix domain-containing protein [Candidatus Nanopelagicales bacterium]
MEPGEAAGPGALIAQTRAARGLTVEDLSRATRLRPGLLEQFEDDDFTASGGDAYARGHLRGIAVILDLDPDTLLALYGTSTTVRRPPGA